MTDQPKQAAVCGFRWDNNGDLFYPHVCRKESGHKGNHQCTVRGCDQIHEQAPTRNRTIASAAPASEFWPIYCKQRGWQEGHSLTQGSFMEFAEAYAAALRKQVRSLTTHSYQDCEVEGCSICDEIEREVTRYAHLAGEMTLKLQEQARILKNNSRKTIDVLCDCSDGWKERAEKAEEQVHSLTEALGDGFVIIEGLQRGSVWEIAPEIRSAMKAWAAKAEAALKAAGKEQR
jgi:hypothetical protein